MWRYSTGSGGRRQWLVMIVALALLPAHCGAIAQAVAVAPDADRQRLTLDRVVAVVNSDLILESDVDAERRFAAFQPFTEPATETRERFIERLIDRDLILQQLRVQPEAPITDAQVNERLETLRKAIPACAAYHCDMDAGWQKYIADQGFTLDQLREHWRMRMEVLRFIEERFRMGIRITPEEIHDYYTKTMVPAYQKEKVTPVPEATISDRIEEILLQQRVTALLDDWLKALRAQGSVRILSSGEALP